MIDNNILFLVIDLFCGFGGTTKGFETATYVGADGKIYKIAKVIACVNHDPKAIKSHWLNHPEIKHFEEDYRNIDLTELKSIVDFQKKLYPNAKIILWASLPCPHFSRAAGGTPKDDEIRTLAYSLYMKYDDSIKKHYKGDSYIQLLNPDYVMIENVTEFKSWGPLDENGKPISKKNGQDWVRFCNGVCDLGYKNEWRELNSADFGEYTSRNRLFGCFAKNGLPIVWPQPTHSKNGDNSVFSQLKKHKAVKEVLDFEDEGKSIFNRKKPLSDKTIDVIHKGLVKAIEEGEDSILFKYYGNGDNTNSINKPAGTLTTKDRFAKIAFIFRQYKTGYTTSINSPIGALPTNPKANIVSFIMNRSHGGHTTSVNNPCPVIIARQDKAPLYLLMALMDEHGIVDIKHRMLKVPELLKIQGFPEDYKMIGNQSDKKRFIGNSVVPGVVKAWCESFAKQFNQLEKVA